MRDVPTRIGVIADTHGLLRPEAVAALTGVALIVHAGDIGSAAVLDELSTLAPTIAVRGNNDHGPWAHALPLQLRHDVAGFAFDVVHDVADHRPSAPAARLVISGHSHRATHAEREGVQYLNPGSAGPRRFRLPVTLALVTVARGTVDIVIRELAVAPRTRPFV
jgi:putative phosphoesterase